MPPQLSSTSILQPILPPLKLSICSSRSTGGVTTLLPISAVMIRLVEFQLKSQDFDGAWQSYEEYSNSGGNSMPAALWPELRFAARKTRIIWTELLRNTNCLAYCTSHRKAIPIGITVCWSYLPQEFEPSEQALKFYNAAAASAVPHAEWDSSCGTSLWRLGPQIADFAY